MHEINSSLFRHGPDHYLDVEKATSNAFHRIDSADRDFFPLNVSGAAGDFLATINKHNHTFEKTEEGKVPVLFRSGEGHDSATHVNSSSDSVIVEENNPP